MSFEVRRVVTGHDENGKAKVLIDEISDNVISRRPGQHSTVIWATDRPTPDLGALNDISADVTQTTVPNGTVFRVSRLAPGVTPRTHRTESLDYAIVLAGTVEPGAWTPSGAFGSSFVDELPGVESQAINT